MQRGLESEEYYIDQWKKGRMEPCLKCKCLAPRPKEKRLAQEKLKKDQHLLTHQEEDKSGVVHALLDPYGGPQYRVGVRLDEARRTIKSRRQKQGSETERDSMTPAIKKRGERGTTAPCSSKKTSGIGRDLINKKKVESR